MHEYSIIQALINQVENIAKENGAKEVKKIIIKIGVMSGVEVELLKIAYDTFKEISPFTKSSKLIINLQKVKIKCLECNSENELKKSEYLCPKCKSDKLDIIDGEDMYLESLEMK